MDDPTCRIHHASRGAATTPLIAIPALPNGQRQFEQGEIGPDCSGRPASLGLRIGVEASGPPLQAGRSIKNRNTPPWNGSRMRSGDTCPTLRSGSPARPRCRRRMRNGRNLRCAGRLTGDGQTVSTHAQSDTSSSAIPVPHCAK